MLDTLKSRFKKLKSRFTTQKIRSRSKSLSPRTKSLSPRTKSEASKKLEKFTKLKASFSKKIAHAPDCAICLAKIWKKDKQAILSTCGHIFHRDCINRIIEKGNTTCPLCRAEFTRDDILTLAQYDRRHNNQPHTLNKTRKIFNEVMTECKQEYEDWNKAKKAYHEAKKAFEEAETNYLNHNTHIPHWMHPTRYLWKKKDDKLYKIYTTSYKIYTTSEAEAIQKWHTFKIKCKHAAPLTSRSRKNYSPNRYTEFNEFIHSDYEKEDPGTLRMVTHYKDGNPILFNVN